jgi:hypothetical protein
MTRTATVTKISPTQDPLAEVLRLIDLEDEGESTAQAYSMRAARALFDLKESPAWVEEMEARKAAEEARTNRAVQWSPNSERTFHIWLTEKVIETGRPRQMGRSEMQRLLNAEGMRRIVVKVAPRGATLPQTEGQWRPAAALYKSGYHKQLVEAVLLAGKIAGEEGAEGITQGIMSAAKGQVWKNDSEIQARSAHPDQATERDKAIKARNEAERWIKELWRRGQADQLDDFAAWVTEWLRNWQAVK